MESGVFMTSRRAWLVASLTVALAGCGSKSNNPSVSIAIVDPSCGNNASDTQVTIMGSLPVNAHVSLAGEAGSQVNATYRAWVDKSELTNVQWNNAQSISAVVPAGMLPGTYPVSVQSPFGSRTTKNAAFVVQAGACPAPSAALLTTVTASPATVTKGNQITVSASVLNFGVATAGGVTAAIASAPSELTLASDLPQPQNIPAGESRTFTWTFQANAPDGGTFLVDTTGTATDTQLPVSAPPASSNQVLVNPTTILQANTVATPTQVNVGQQITVALTASNLASAPVTITPTITATGPVNVTNSPTAASIPPGKNQYQFVWTYVPTGPGQASFTASISGTDPTSQQQVTVPTATVAVTVQTVATLAATLSIPTGPLPLGDFEVDMTVANGGGATANDVVPADPVELPISTAAVRKKSGPTPASATVVAGQPNVTFRWTYTATAPGTLALSGQAQGTDANSRQQVVSNVATSNTASVAPPTITSVSPNTAPSGTPVTIVGLDLAPATLASPVVSFGGVTATVTNINATGNQITVTAPPHDPGVVEVSVTVPPSGLSASLQNAFTFVPSLTNISPATGPVAGGTAVVLTGTGFVPGAVTVYFGNTAVTPTAINISNVNAEQITLTTPAGGQAGQVNVTVSSNSESSSALGFTYTP